MLKPTEKNASRTSFHGVFLMTSLRKLKRFFPKSYVYGGKDGSNHYFLLENDRGDVITIYDVEHRFDDVYTFHVGGETSDITEEFRAIFLLMTIYDEHDD
jgi:hypothetical protein